MRTTRIALALLVALCLCATGCVERKMFIRSDPAGARVFVDEQPVGQTPVVLPFSHYGTRRVRIGPIYNEVGAIAYPEQERLVEVEAPWYETFPVDFFSEVLVPWTLVDNHPVDFTLKPAGEQEGAFGQERAKETMEEAESFRRKALAPVQQ